MKVKVNVDVINPNNVNPAKGEEQVRNRLTYIDKDTNQVVASYSWVDEKNSGQNKKLNDGSLGVDLDQTVKGLGYIILSNSPATDEEPLIEFGDKDKTINEFVQKINKFVQDNDLKIKDDHGQDTDFKVEDNTPLTWGQVNELIDRNDVQVNHDVNFINSNGYNSVDFLRDPANFIANVASLPKGTKVNWKVEPTYGSDGEVNNKPVIEVSDEKGTKSITIPLNDDDIALLSTNKMPGYFVPAWKDTVLQVGDKPSPVDELDKEQMVNNLWDTELADSKGEYQFTDSAGQEKTVKLTKADVENYLFNEGNWSWEIAPDTSKPGYTVAFATFSAPKPSSDNPTEQALYTLALATFSAPKQSSTDEALYALTQGLAGLQSGNGVRLKVDPISIPWTELTPAKKPDTTPTVIPWTPLTPANTTPTVTLTPTPKTPDTPNNPDTPDAPNTPETPQAPAETPDTPEAPQQNAEPKTQQTKRTPAPAQVKQTTQKSTPVVQNAAQKQAALPQTGAKQSLASLVLAVLTFGLSLVFFKKDKRTN